MDDSATVHNPQEEIKRLQAEVKLKTEQLMASTSRAYSFLDSLHLGFVMCDVSGGVVLVNNSAHRLLSDKAGTAENPLKTEWSLITLDELFRPELQLQQSVLNCLKTGLPQEFKEVNFDQKVLHVLLAPILGGDMSPGQQLGAVILLEDITEQVILARSKDTFLAIASHELRTPLTVITGNASIIKTYYANSLSGKVSKIIDDIEVSADRLIIIVNDFLDVSALEQGKLNIISAAFSLPGIVDEVVNELANLSNAKSIELVTDDSIAAVPAVYADQTRIKQVIYNLISNAIKFTSKGRITLASRADDKFVYVTVTDTGLGMSTESQTLLFRKFQQTGDNPLTRDSTKGTGLGLYISKLITEQSGGRIWLESSEPGKGSTFTFSLPRSTGS